MTVLSPFDEVIRDFAEAQHLPRIKKLLVYACTQQWESDPDQLAKFNLHYLVETLMQLAPTVDQLRTYLTQITQSLSKPAEYLLIANTIVQALRKLYVGSVSSSHLNANPHLYWQAAQTLEQHPEHLRIRKLLVLVCRNYWETDRDRLFATNLPDLLMELHHLTQDVENLRAVITSVVQTTSKPQQYGAIAQQIIQACYGLYHVQPVDKTEICPPSNVTTSNSTHSSNPPAPQVSAAPTQPDPPLSYGEAEAEFEASESTDLDLQLIPSFSSAELFDLRLEIMKYTVPLLAKHLLFLAIYTPPGQASEEEQAEFADDPDAWAHLRTRDLDDLIKASLRQYPTPRDLHVALHLTAKALKTSQQYKPVACAIVRALKTLVAKHQSSFSHAPQAKQQRRDMQQVQRGEDRTCRIASATVTFQEPSPTLRDEAIRINLHSNGGSKTGKARLVRESSSPSEETAALPDPKSCAKPCVKTAAQSVGDRSSGISEGRSPAPHQTQSQETECLPTSNQKPSGFPAGSPQNGITLKRSTSTDETALITE